MDSDIKKINVSARGVTPLIMHNVQMADPLNRWTLESASLKNKRSKKTESDIEKLYEIGFLSSLYWSNELNGLYMPTDNIRKMLLEAARGCDSKGAKKQIVGVRFTEYLGYPIETENRDNIEAIRDNPKNRYFKIVKVGMAKVPNVRAIFHQWSFDFQMEIDASIVNVSTVEEWVEYAGDRVGIGSRRPYGPTPGEYGRFVVEKFEEINE